jgi:hypothetical protein
MRVGKSWTKGTSYQEYTTRNGGPYQARHFQQLVADDLDIEAKRVYVGDDDSHNRKGQNSLDELAEVSYACAVALKDLTGQSSDSAGIEGVGKRLTAIDRGHESRTQGFDQELRKEQAGPGPDEDFPWLGRFTYVYGIV